jgi:hypothetical protein
LQPIGESEASLRHVSRDDPAEILGRASCAAQALENF